MKKILIIMLLIHSVIAINCTEFSIKTDISAKQNLGELKKIGVLQRLSHSSTITLDEQSQNIASWISNYESADKVSIITDCSKNLSTFSSIQNKIFQSTGKDTYLKYKSIGVLNLYLRKNEEELKEIISQKSLDGIIIYEIYSIVSLGMQFMDFDSVFAIVDKNLNILYLDHQTDGYDIDEHIIERVNSQLMDKISGRLIQNLMDLDIIGDIVER